MDNTVGSLSNFNDSNFSYILGLWGADKYVRTSSVGLSNTNLVLINTFANFLYNQFPKDRVRLRIYGQDIPKGFEDIKSSICKGSKNVSQAYHIYVNSRPFIRMLAKTLEDRIYFEHLHIGAYFAGRFDGDGSISIKRTHCRIAYGSFEDLQKDKFLLDKVHIDVSSYRYKDANTYCIYFRKRTLETFLDIIKPHLLAKKL